MKQTRRFITAKEAVTILNIKLSTLYAYVSRGLVRSEPTGAKKRSNRYFSEDIYRLKERQELRRNPVDAVTKSAATALHFGQPVLESAITLIAEGRLYYRGYDAITLAKKHSFEEVAVLLWDETADQPLSWQQKADSLFSGQSYDSNHLFQTIQKQVADLTPVEQFQILLPLASSNDFSAYDFRPEAVRQTGSRILKLMVSITAGVGPNNRTLAGTLQQAWIPNEPQSAEWLNEVLILCADHELNLSAFTARCVASGETTLYGVISAGLAALQGARHGGYTGRVEALFRETGRPEQTQAALKERLKRGEKIPGFDHPLYPMGDPRARALLSLAKMARPNSTAVLLAEAISKSTLELVGQLPTLDFGLVTLALALQLPPGSALALFALGRTAGWIGHTLEQQRLQQLIRPRAKYIGPAIKSIA